jgi:hypothetical protein
MISQKNFHAIFSLDGPKAFFHSIDSEGWLWESELYPFSEVNCSTAFDNAIYILTLFQYEVLLLHLHSILSPINYSQLLFA